MNGTTDEKIFSMKWKNFVPMVFAIIISTNTVSLILNNQLANTEKIEYNNDANKRRIKNQAKELEYKMKIHELQERVRDCKEKQ